MAEDTGAIPCLDLGNARLKGARVGLQVLPLPGQGIGPGTFSLAPDLREALAGADLILLVSTNPARLPEVRRALETVVPRVLLAGEDFPLSLPTRYREPDRCGADRLVAALAAQELGRGKVVVVDAGTAITVDGVNGEGTFLGGQILPGLGLSLEALARHTALPSVSLAELQDPVPVLGRSTVECLVAGARHGLLAGLTATVALVAGEVGPGAPLLVTGADGPLLAALWGTAPPPQVGEVRLAPHLVVQGLARAFQLWG